MTMFIIIIVAMIAIMFFTSRSSKKREQEAAQMRNNLCVGDEITTIGGIIGKIVSIKDETMVIETTRDHTRIRFLKSAVRSVDVPANVRFEKPAEETPLNAEPAQGEEKKSAIEAAPLKKGKKKAAKKEPVKEVVAPAEEAAAKPVQEPVAEPAESNEEQNEQ